MTQQTILDRFWLWGMQVNALQQTDGFASLGFGESRLTVDAAMRRTGASNVILAGGLPISEATLAGMPRAKRVLCKWSLHHHVGNKTVIDYEDCLARMLDAKRLAAADTRIDGYHIDDFSTGSIDAGATPEHIQRLLYTNSVCGPRIPLSSTIYTMTLNRPELPAFLPYFDQFLVPLWHADQIETIPDALRRFADLSGSKPVMLCLYVFDFGNGKPIPRNLMQRHLQVAEELLLAQWITGLCICGTCMMDLDWEANHVLYEWLERVGGKVIA
jgi:hypothetical protein